MAIGHQILQFPLTFDIPLVGLGYADAGKLGCPRYFTVWLLVPIFDLKCSVREFFHYNLLRPTDLRFSGVARDAKW
jgi:hypothetical protein